MAASLDIRIQAHDLAGNVLRGVTGHISDMGNAAQKSRGLLGGFTDVLGKIGLAGLGVKAVADGLGGLVSGLMGDAIGAQEIAKATDAVLASTKGAAGMSAAAIADLASSLSAVVPFEDEAIQGGENLLLTFTNIGKDIFPDATEAMLNMSQVLGQDMKSSAIQLGKALNDPIKGASALQRVGVALTEQQLKQIKVFQESGDLLSAQKIILGELSTEFGGAARAAGETFAGKMTILQTQIGNVKEAIGGALLPVITGLLDKMMPLIVGFGQWLPAAFDTMKTAVQPVGDLIDNLIGVFTDAEGAGLQLHNALETMVGLEVANTIIAVVQNVQSFAGTVIGIAGALLLAWKSNFLGIQDIVMSVLNVLVPFIQQMMAIVMDWVRENWPLMQKTIETVMHAIQAVVTFVLNMVLDIWEGHGKQIMTIVEAIWTIIKTVIETTIRTILDVLKIVMQVITGDWEGAWTTLQGMTARIWGAIKVVISAALTIIKSALSLAWDGIAAGATAAWNGIAGAIGGIWDDIVRGIKDRINGIIGLLNKLIDAWNSLGFHVPGFSVDLPSVDVPGVGRVGGGGLGWGGIDVGVEKLARLPSLGAGGIVPGALGAPILIKAHGGETVTPPGQLIDYDKLVAALARQPLVVQLDGQTLARVLRPYSDGQVRL